MSAVQKNKNLVFFKLNLFIFLCVTYIHFFIKIFIIQEQKTDNKGL